MGIIKGRQRLVLIWVLVLTLCLAIVGCAGNNNEKEPASEEPNASATNEESTDEVALEPYEVTIVFPSNPQKDEAMIEEKLNAYFKDKINATVDLQPYDFGSYQQKTELMMSSSEKMDLVFAPSWYNFFGNVANGAFLPLDDLLEEHGKGIKENMHPLYLEGPKYKGKLYAIPTNKEIAQGKNIVFRKDIVDKYGLDYKSVKTIEDLIPMFQTIKDKEPGIIPNFVAESAAMDFLMFETNGAYRQVGPSAGNNGLFFIDTASSTVEVKSLIDPEIASIVTKEYELYRQLFEKGFTNKDAATSKTHFFDLLKQGKVWLSKGTYKPGGVEENIMKNESGTGPEMFEFYETVISEPFVSTDAVTGSQMAISRTSEDPARAMMVLNLMHTDPYVVNLLIHGVEDVHYKKVGDNRIELVANSGYSPGLHWILGNQMLNYLKPGQPDDLYEKMKQFNENAQRSPLLGFVFDNENVKNELSQLSTIVTEFGLASTGALPDPAEKLEERNKKLESAGIQKVKEELQKQIDAWLKEQQ